MKTFRENVNEIDRGMVTASALIFVLAMKMSSEREGAWENVMPDGVESSLR